MSIREQNKKWIGRGAWAIADQALFALANVLLNVLLARWLTPVEYGAFAVGYSLFLFIGAFHTALLTEPLLVFGPGKYADQPRTYLSLLLRGHWMLTAAGSLLLIMAGLVLRYNGIRPLSQALLGLALATPFSLLMWFSRRAAYVRFQARLATIASAGYLVLLLAGLIGLAGFHLVSIFSAMLTLSVAGAISGLWLMKSIHRALPDEEESITPMPVVTDHWRYGRWASATSVLMWVPLNLFFVVLSILVNFEATGAFKALSNLVLPLLQANAALGSLLLPAMALRVRNHEQFKKLLRTSLLLFAAGACIYSLLIGAFGGELVHLIYGGRYDSRANLLRLLLLIPLLDGAMVVLSNALRSLERPDRVFWAQLAVVLFLLTAGVEATRLSGLWGATGGLVAAELLGTIVLGASVLSQLKHQGRAEVPSLGRAQKPLLTLGGLLSLK
jgi:O-antigen/teichoic acid export membrane protein